MIFNNIFYRGFSMMPDLRGLNYHSGEAKSSAPVTKCYILVQPTQKGERSYLLRKESNIFAEPGEMAKLKPISYRALSPKLGELTTLWDFSEMAKKCGWEEGYKTCMGLFHSLTKPDHERDHSHNYKKLTFENKIIYHITADATPENIESMLDEGYLTAIPEGEVIGLVYNSPSSHSLMGCKVGKSLRRIFHMVYGEPYTQPAPTTSAPISAIPVPAPKKKAKSSSVVAPPFHGTSRLEYHFKDKLESENKRLKVDSSEVSVLAGSIPALDTVNSIPKDRGFPPGFPSEFLPSAPPLTAAPVVAQEEGWEAYDPAVWEQGHVVIEDKEYVKCGCCPRGSSDL